MGVFTNDCFQLVFFHRFCDVESIKKHLSQLTILIRGERKIVIRDVTLDYDSFTVSSAATGEKQVLPQKEFLLLYKLLSFPGKIFTRIQLMDEIWGADTDTGWETVTVHIGRLRKRFDSWNVFSLESVRGLGYRAVINK